jgi:hypothetical protein
MASVDLVRSYSCSPRLPDLRRRRRGEAMDNSETGSPERRRVLMGSCGDSGPLTIQCTVVIALPGSSSKCVRLPRSNVKNTPR